MEERGRHYNARLVTLSAGTRLGPYEIVEPIGAGGMGEVYKARDRRLDRTVAVKVLAADVASDPEFRERFNREARSISALDHPHICALYDIGEHEGLAYLVMQHLEGETLAARLQRGPLPLDHALTCAMQIAGALDQAHRRGIVHRDLKPGNVMLTKTGAKLLDFGLAKAAPPAVSGTAATALADSPGAGGSPLTAQGSIVGTFQYMAPEQIEGRDVDARADIFAFGAVLYEMITRRRAFDGQTQASLIAAILEREPPSLATIAPMTPPQIDHVVRRALAKDPDDRWQSARDLVWQLEWIAAQAPGPPVASVPGRRRLRVMPVLGGVVIGSVLTALLTWRLMPPANQASIIRAVVSLPADAIYGVWGPTVAISPDGRRIVYTAMQDGQPTLFVRPIDRFESEPIRGSGGARNPFFSPDGQHVGFFSDGKLKRVALGGSLPVPICEAPDMRGASWGPDGTIVFAPGVDSGLMTVPAGGGTPQPLTTRNEQARERTHRFPHMLPGGRAVVFMIGTTDITTYSDARIAVQRLDGGAPTVIVEGGSSPRVAAGHLLYGRGDVLLAAPFDESRLQVTGPAVRVVDGVSFRSAFGITEYDVAADGTLIFAPGGETQPTSRLVWFDRSGRSTPFDNPLRFLVTVQLSPDARQILLINQGANDALWVRDLQRGTATRVTPPGNTTGGTWSHDGQRVIFGDSIRVAAVPPDGSAAEEELYRDPSFVAMPMASPDGTAVFFTASRPGMGTDIWRLSLESRRAEPWLASRFNEGSARPSHEGSLVAYSSDETGQLEVFVRPAAGGTRVQVSTIGATAPVWSRDDRELFFLSGADLYSVPVRSVQPIDLGVPQRLFAAHRPWVGALLSPWIYDVMPDGRFLFIETTSQSRPQELRLVQAATPRRQP